MKDLPEAEYTSEQIAVSSGVLKAIDTRKLARLAKLAGAPFDSVAGLRLHIRTGTQVTAGDSLFTLYSASPGERDYALEYYQHNLDIFAIE
jgi:thymidine phosphorylase